MASRHGPVRRYDGSSQMRSNDPCPTSMQRASCVRDVPHNASCVWAHPGYWPYLVGRVLAPVSRDDRSSRARDAAIEHRTGTEHIAVRRPARERGALREV